MNALCKWLQQAIICTQIYAPLCWRFPGLFSASLPNRTPLFQPCTHCTQLRWVGQQDKASWPACGGRSCLKVQRNRGDDDDFIICDDFEQFVPIVWRAALLTWKRSIAALTSDIHLRKMWERGFVNRTSIIRGGNVKQNSCCPGLSIKIYHFDYYAH